MKLSVIHNTYRFNHLIRESVILNLKALEQSGVDYEYIVFNDNGDTSISDVVSDLPVIYHYSDVNFGHKQCSGGWVGAIPILTGDLIHNTGQDDVFTSLFYRESVKLLSTTDASLVYSNGFKVRENMCMTGETLGPMHPLNYSSPREVFNNWMGVLNNKITKANNYIPAPGVMYKKSLHTEIGLPDLDTFRGVGDFEYWARVLFYKKIITYLPMPNWCYRLSTYTTSAEIIDGSHNERDLSPIYIDIMKHKYQTLLDNE